MPEVLTAPHAGPAGSALSRANPFPGLRPYEEADANWFFGRGGEINELLKRLRRLHFVAIVGASGSGKSSVVRAGVLPQIRDGYLDSEWTIATFRPGERPIANLAEALAEADSRLTESTRVLREGSLGLVRALAPARGKVLILVDQFEEIFQFARRTGDAAQEEVKEFLKLLLAAANSENVDAYVVITMRLEWLNECAAYPGLAEAINEGIYLVPQMTRRQFQQAILGPLESADGSITSALLGRMLNDLDNKTDQLPVLQHAMMRIWERTGASDAFDAPAYEAVGTFTNCLSAHAEEVFAGLSDREQVVAELLFRNITQVYQNRKIRRPRSIGDIARVTSIGVAELASVIPAFSKAGRSFLVTTEGALTAETIVDVSHEALIRQWVRLCGWVEDEADRQSRVSRLETDAAEWDRDRKRFRESLYGGYELQRAEELRPTLDPEGRALAFLNESRRVRRRRRVIKRGSITVALALLVGFVFVLYYVRSRGQLEVARAQSQFIETQRQSAEKEARRAQAEHEDLVKKIEGANGSVTALAALAKEVSAKRIYVQYVSRDLQLARSTQVQLKGLGYAVPGVEQVDAGKAPGQNQVRFFHAEDRADAGKLAAQLKGIVAGNVQLEAVTDTKGVVPAGQFEVWLAPSAVVAGATSPAGPAPTTVPAANVAIAPVTSERSAPTILATSSAAEVLLGEDVTLTWRAENATSASMFVQGTHSVYSLPPSGSKVVSPTRNTTYVFSASSDSARSEEGYVRVDVIVPAPTPAPVVPVAAAPAAPAPTAIASGEPALIRAALTRYREAYESESLDDVRSAWPSVSKNDQKNMSTVFNTFNAIRLNLSYRDEDIHIEGTTASVQCRQTFTYTQKGKKLPEQASINTFRLRKVGGSWVLDGVQ